MANKTAKTTEEINKSISRQQSGFEMIEQIIGKNIELIDFNNFLKKLQDNDELILKNIQSQDIFKTIKEEEFEKLKEGFKEMKIEYSAPKVPEKLWKKINNYERELCKGWSDIIEKNYSNINNGFAKQIFSEIKKGKMTDENLWIQLKNFIDNYEGFNDDFCCKGVDYKLNPLRCSPGNLDGCKATKDYVDNAAALHTTDGIIMKNKKIKHQNIFTDIDPAGGDDRKQSKGFVCIKSRDDDNKKISLNLERDKEHKEMVTMEWEFSSSSGSVFNKKMGVNTKTKTLSVANCMSRFLDTEEFDFDTSNPNMFVKNIRSEKDILEDYFIPKLFGDFGQELYAVQNNFPFFANDKPSAARYIIMSLFQTNKGTTNVGGFITAAAGREGNYLLVKNNINGQRGGSHHKIKPKTKHQSNRKSSRFTRRHMKRRRTNRRKSKSRRTNRR